MSSKVVEQHQFVSVDGRPTPVYSRWSYLARDPYAVTLAFRTRRGDWIEWCFARDLLRDGLTGQAGLGDVRVRPDLVAPGKLLVLELESPDGYALVELKRADVERFLAASERAVPHGSEGALVDVDAFIRQVTEV
ncbi:SsgA family sporulation/cell division regulator [Amycolatopsis cynarae]|uniref:SsgA family sporulation/cell division regulator n=1 Tax=Amycolatopsis cynarae TaxID=2995223 RepID=A0ABY7BC82_9PSEU|nr:SsgA family sporulation/cell division regulator [Amycolatopsis sp. HUAS 11-8]WAL69756.1 SsgA family sporulation/cell division regulator [Amycolatopsis sp. HUAS 11-8]